MQQCKKREARTHAGGGVLGGCLPWLSSTGCPRKGRKAFGLFCELMCTAAVTLLNMLLFKIVGILHNHINTRRLAAASQASRNELFEARLPLPPGKVASRKEYLIAPTTPSLHTEKIAVCRTITLMLVISVKLVGC